jgi:ribosomal protein S6
VNLYEGMFIFPEAMKEEALEAAVGNLKAEIEKLGGGIESATRLGRRGFARRMGKQGAGHYVVANFRLGGEALPALHERLKLAGEVFRVQITRAEPTPPPKPAKEPEAAAKPA